MNIINATPMSYNRGMRDVGRRQLLPVPLNQPSHLPKSFIFARKGKVGKNHLAVGDSRASIFGLETFDPLKPYFNHATIFNNIFNAAGNASCIERVLPADAPPPAAIRLSLDLLPTEVQDYERNADGTYKIDATTGLKLPAGAKLPGFLGKWVAEVIPVVDNQRQFGVGAIGPGDQTDATTSAQSTRYPIIDLLVSSEGEWGNDQGISIWAQSLITNTPVDTRLITDQKVYPFQIAVKYRPDALSSAETTATLSGSQSIPFVLKPGVIDRNTEQQLYLGDVFVDAYQDISTPGMAPTYGAFDKIKVYDNNVSAVLALVYPVEEASASGFSDFDGTADEQYRFNLFTAVSSQGAPYHTFQLVSGAGNSVVLRETATIYAKGGGDGTMTDAVFANLVKAKLEQYGDKNSFRQNAVHHPENMFWDSGFPLEVKKSMSNFIAVRKGTFVMASTHVVGGPELTAEQEMSVAISLTSVFQNFPESEYYATPTVRACVIAGSGYLLNSKFTKALPISADLAAKWSAYMGASNGKWISTAKPDVNPNNVVNTMRDVNVPWRPAGAKYKAWDAGMVWPEPYSMDMQFFPQHQTVYPDDTSPLNGAITAFACTTLVALAEKAHRDHTGRQDLTRDQMAESINNHILGQVDGRFDERYIIQVETQYTADDDRRGYSWTTVIKVGAPMMQTVQTLSVETYRREDLQAA